MLPRLAKEQDAAEISALIVSSATNAIADFNDDAWQLFLQMNDEKGVLQRINDPSVLMYCVEKNAQLAGMICVRGWQKIELMFVLPESSNQGIARMLWQHVKMICEKRGYYSFWVRSSSNAIPVYQSFGFVTQGELSSSYGITYQLMELEGQAK